ncbi:hypothetical protein [Clostridium perfringens]|uniref:hypothetical protein n=1 Tax=Clostridium perfringens TaxID=1502 RepID=UPI001E3F8D2B|nr:hypothetical protein [Clostridium perfringens]WVL78292.1 hypothetical protein LMS42_015120 [Clostridium perfringens]
MKKITLDDGREFNIRLLTSREEVKMVFDSDDIYLGRYYEIAHDNNISKCSSEFKYITKTLVEEAIENKDKLYNEDDVGIVFCVNEKYYRIGCPTTIGLDERCQASCRTCWKESLWREGARIESFNKALKEHNIDKDSIIKHISKKEKLKTLEDFRNGKDVEVIGIRLFKLNDKVYNSCPDNFGLESNETNEGCKFNPSCDRCKGCWKKNIKDYLEGEE